MMNQDYKTVNYAVRDIYGYELHTDVVVVDIDCGREDAENEAMQDFAAYVAEGCENSHEAQMVLSSVADIIIG
jgi:hypothetical protein